MRGEPVAAPRWVLGRGARGSPRGASGGKPLPQAKILERANLNILLNVGLNPGVRALFYPGSRFIVGQVACGLTSIAF